MTIPFIIKQIKQSGEEEDFIIAQNRMQSCHCTGGYHFGKCQSKLSPFSLKRNIKELNLSFSLLIHENAAKRGECSSVALKRR